jgi:hypothetical protein
VFFFLLLQSANTLFDSLRRLQLMQLTADKIKVLQQEDEAAPYYYLDFVLWVN